VLCGAVPGGLKGRGVRGACASMPNGAAVRRARARSVVCAGSILAGGAESENIPRSDRERDEGFQLTGSVVVAVALAVTRSERGEGFHRSGATAVAVRFVVETTRSERGLQEKQDDRKDEETKEYQDVAGASRRAPEPLPRRESVVAASFRPHTPTGTGGQFNLGLHAGDENVQRGHAADEDRCGEQYLLDPGPPRLRLGDRRVAGLISGRRAATRISIPHTPYFYKLTHGLVVVPFRARRRGSSRRHGPGVRRRGRTRPRGRALRRGGRSRRRRRRRTASGWSSRGRRSGGSRGRRGVEP